MSQIDYDQEMARIKATRRSTMYRIAVYFLWQFWCALWIVVSFYKGSWWVMAFQAFCLVTFEYYKMPHYKMIEIMNAQEQVLEILREQSIRDLYK